MLRSKPALLVAMIILRVAAIGQTSELYVGDGPNSLIIKASESFTISGLTLNPSGDLDLTSKQIMKSETVANAVNQMYVPIVYRFMGNINSFSGSVTISYTGVSHSLNETNFKLLYHDGTRWIRDGNSTVDTGNDIVTSSSLSGVTINELTISDIASVLPVRWLGFTARTEGETVVLEWSTGSEQHTMQFEVEHSTTVQSWTTLGSVHAAGTSNSPRHYVFTHHTPSKRNEYNYYRIKQLDLDGRFSYSRIIGVIHRERNSNGIAFPNPATSSLLLYLPSEQEVHITNIAGVTVWRMRLPAGRHHISVAQFKRGAYLLKAGNQCQRIVLQ